MVFARSSSGFAAAAALSRRRTLDRLSGLHQRGCQPDVRTRKYSGTLTAMREVSVSGRRRQRRRRRRLRGAERWHRRPRHQPWRAQHGLVRVAVKVREAAVHQSAAGAPPPAARPAVVRASFARVVDAAVGGVRAVREDVAAVEAALLPAQPGHSKHGFSASSTGSERAGGRRAGGRAHRSAAERPVSV